MEQDTKDFYDRFRKQLSDSQDFPTHYTYKFIIPTEHSLIAKVQKVFDQADPQFQMKSSKNGKYTSITTVIYALDPDQVIHYYQKVAKIDKVIML